MNSASWQSAVAGETASADSTVLIIDDHRSFGDLLAAALTSVTGLSCVGTAVSAAEGVALASTLHPDVVMMDIQMPDQDGLWATRKIVESTPTTAVVMMTAHRDPRWVTRAAQAGACGFVPKDGSLTEIIDLVRQVRPGHMLVAPSMYSAPAGSTSAASASSAGPQLTDRESQVLQMLGQGLTAAAIGRHLGLSLHTCRGYIKSLHGKLGVTSQLEAVVKAQHLGLIGATPWQ